MSRVTVSGANLPPPDDPSSQPIIPPRLNIANLIKEDKQWSLYIQALSELGDIYMQPPADDDHSVLFQHVDPAKPLSWFAIAGIHGFPLDTQWEQGGAKTGIGYCVHGLPHSHTCDRPYLALYDVRFVTPSRYSIFPDDILLVASRASRSPVDH